MNPKTQRAKSLEDIKLELLDLVDNYFPKIKPRGINKGRGEAAVIVGVALVLFSNLLAEERKKGQIEGEAKVSSSMEKKLHHVHKITTGYWNKIKDFKVVAKQMDAFNKMLLKEKRTTIEELSKYFKSKEERE